jgi:hypothetical protein
MCEAITTQPAFVFHPGKCPDCWDSLVAYTPEGIKPCEPCIRKGEASPAALRLSETVWERKERKLPVEIQTLNLARYLIHSTPEEPLYGYTLQGYLRATEREVKAAARELRREWVLPIGSSRKPPYGYYWMLTAKDFLAWARVYRAQAIDELVTLYRMQRRNYPELSGQGKLGFVEAVTQEIEEAIQ